MVRALTIGAVAPRVEDEFRVGMVSDGRLEFARSVADIVVHFGQVLDELGFWFGVAAPPVFIGNAVSIVVFTVNVVFVNLTVAIVIAVIYWTIVNIVI